MAGHGTNKAAKTRRDKKEQKIKRKCECGGIQHGRPQRIKNTNNTLWGTTQRRHYRITSISTTFKVHSGSSVKESAFPLKSVVVGVYNT